VAIVVDVTHATDVPGIDERQNGSHALGSGPVVGRGSTLHPQVVEALHAAGEAEGIAFTVEASARATGTDADAIALSRAGVPCGLVGLPLRYMHSPVEVVQVSDVLDAARLIAAFCRALEPGTAFAR
jgi:endoglucanase